MIDKQEQNFQQSENDFTLNFQKSLQVPLYVWYILFHQDKLVSRYHP